jgi:RNA polymerase sigma-70 factor (ECF subfamily)
MSTTLDARTLVDRYGGRVHAIARRLGRNAHDADEIAQETLLRAIRKVDQFEGRSDPITWLYTIALRVSRRMRARAIKRGMPSLESLMPGGGSVADPSAIEGGSASLRREARGAIEDAIARLPEVYRLPLVLKDLAELPVEEAGRLLGLRPATVKTRVHRARLLLRAALDKALPKVTPPPVLYEKRVCMDLLAAKQAALDRGDSFPLDEVVCERCRVVFGGLDAARDLCRELSAGKLPVSVRAEVMRAAAALAKPVRKGRPKRSVK